MMLQRVNSNRPPLDIWLGKQVPSNDACEWVELRHLRADETASRIERWHASDVREKQEDNGGATQALAAEIAHAAQIWADQIQSGPQRFMVALVDAKDIALCQFLMTLSSKDGPLSGAFSTEAPNIAGITSQLMRHSEAGMRAAIGTTASSLDRLEKELDRKQARIEVLEARWLETLSLVEELQSRRAERELEAMSAQRKEARKDHIVEKLSVLIPVAAQKFLGNKGGGQQAGGQDPVLTGLVQSIDGDQLQAIARQLRPEQLAAFLQLVNTYADIPAEGEQTEAAE